MWKAIRVFINNTRMQYNSGNCFLEYSASFVTLIFSAIRFPKSDDERFKLWISYTKRDPLSLTQTSVLCSKHFTEDCFDHSGGSVSLKPDAVPTVAMASDIQQVTNK